MKKLFVLVGAATLAASAAAAGSPKQQASIPDSIVEEIRAWADTPTVVNAIKAQNAKHANLDQGAVETLDKQWRAETKSSSKPMIEGILRSALSSYLRKVKQDARGLYTEIFVMDNRGLNVGQSDITSDFWQGDEDKWQKSYLAGPAGVFKDEVKFDESTQTYQAQISVAIADESGQAIGAVTVGIDVDQIN